MGFTILLFAVGENEDEKEKLRNLTEKLEEKDIEVLDIEDINREFEDLQQYAEKFEKMLPKLNRIFLINSENLREIVDRRDYGNIKNELLKGDDIKNAINNYFSAELAKPEQESRLVLVSWDSGEQTPVADNNMKHIKNACKTESKEVSEQALRIVVQESKLKLADKTNANEKEKKGKKNGCLTS